MSGDKSSLSQPENLLAAPLADAIRDLADVRGDLEQATDALVKAVTGGRWWQEYAHATGDFNAWLIDEHCRARLQHYHPPLDPNTAEGRAALVRERADVVVRWHAELDRRATLRRECAA
jgi:hypothetical protein